MATDREQILALQISLLNGHVLRLAKTFNESGSVDITALSGIEVAAGKISRMLTGDMITKTSTGRVK